MQECLYVGCQDGQVHAVDLDTGTLRWLYQAGASAISSPAVADGIVYVGSQAVVYAIDAATGTLRWRAAPAGDQDMTTQRRMAGDWWVEGPGYHAARHVSPLAVMVTQDTVYAVREKGPLYALDAVTGALRWRYGVNQVPWYRGWAFHRRRAGSGTPRRKSSSSLL
jgi:eukaryotic-like serine/threonine-protein kinase